jgi:hypothetical protein
LNHVLLRYSHGDSCTDTFEQTRHPFALEAPPLADSAADAVTWYS